MSKELQAWIDSKQIEREPKWITAEEFEEKVAQAKAWQVEARADREFYDNDTFWYAQSEPDRDYSGERG